MMESTGKWYDLKCEYKRARLCVLNDQLKGAIALIELHRLSHHATNGLIMIMAAELKEIKSGKFAERLFNKSSRENIEDMMEENNVKLLTILSDKLQDVNSSNSDSHYETRKEFIENHIWLTDHVSDVANDFTDRMNNMSQYFDQELDKLQILTEVKIAQHDEELKNCYNKVLIGLLVVLTFSSIITVIMVIKMFKQQEVTPREYMKRFRSSVSRRFEPKVVYKNHKKLPELQKSPSVVANIYSSFADPIHTIDMTALKCDPNERLVI